MPLLKELGELYSTGTYKSVQKTRHTKYDKCQQLKAPNMSTRGFTTSVLTSSVLPSPCFRLSRNQLFLPSTFVNRWIGVAINADGRYSAAEPLPATTATEVAQFVIDRTIFKLGGTRELFADCGREFLTRPVVIRRF